MSTATTASIGDLLREWRQRRRLSQLDLAIAAGVSSRHLSFVETGRSKPSRELVQHLARELDVPLREHNRLLLAAGYSPSFGETPLDAETMASVRSAVDVILAGHEPFPAVVIDRHWDLVGANTAAVAMMEGVAPHLLGPPLNILRATLHPDGLAGRIVDFETLAAHTLHRLRRQVDLTGDRRLVALYDELRSYPGVDGVDHGAYAGILLPFQLRVPGGVLALFTTVATFGAPLDVTLEELAIESFFPADAFTRTWFQSR